MEIKLIMKSARSAVIEIADGGIYYTEEKYQIFVNHVFWKETETVITSLYGLTPETVYEVVIKGNNGEERLCLRQAARRSLPGWQRQDR